MDRNNTASKMIPTISLTNCTQEEIAEALRDACTKVGFFYLEDHSIAQSLLDDVFDQSKQLFALPLNEKVVLTDPILQRGYTKFEEETLDPKNQPDRYVFIYTMMFNIVPQHSVLC